MVYLGRISAIFRHVHLPLKPLHHLAKEQKQGGGIYQSETCAYTSGHTLIRTTLIVKDFHQECKAGLNILGQIIHFSCFHSPAHFRGQSCRSKSGSSAHLCSCRICISLIMARGYAWLFSAAVHNSALLNIKK